MTQLMSRGDRSEASTGEPVGVGCAILEDRWAFYPSPAIVSRISDRSASVVRGFTTANRVTVSP